jgi:hypothetical protein
LESLFLIFQIVLASRFCRRLSYGTFGKGIANPLTLDDIVQRYLPSPMQAFYGTARKT